MAYKQMMFDLFQKGQKIYEEYAAIDYMKEFEEFNARTRFSMRRDPKGNSLPWEI